MYTVVIVHLVVAKSGQSIGSCSLASVGSDR